MKYFISSKDFNNHMKMYTLKIKQIKTSNLYEVELNLMFSNWNPSNSSLYCFSVTPSRSTYLIVDTSSTYPQINLHLNPLVCNLWHNRTGLTVISGNFQLLCQFHPIRFEKLKDFYIYILNYKLSSTSRQSYIIL